MTVTGNWPKLEDFRTKQTHLVDQRWQYTGVYRINPEPYLRSVATGVRLDHRPRLGVFTTGLMPSGLSAYRWEGNRKVPCEIIVFCWGSLMHFPATLAYYRERLQPYCDPVW